VAVGDFNQDGRQDLAVANLAGNSVTVLLGNGAGGFIAAPGSPFAVGAAPASVAARDVNGDGRLDLAVANSGGNTVTVFLGDGAGGFAEATGSPFAVGSKPVAVAVVDFNGDGAPDLVALNSGSSNVTVISGSGAAVAGPFAVGANPVALAVADFNGDGKPDFAVVNGDGSVTAILNSLPALTANPASVAFYATGSIPVSISSSVSGATYTVSSNQPWLAPTPASGATGGTSTVNPAVGAAGLPPGVYTGTVRYTAPNWFDAATTVTLSVAAPSGTLQPAAGSPFAVDVTPQAIAVADLNNDGYSDIVTASNAGNTVSVLLGDGQGGFAAAAGSPFAVGKAPYSVAAGDFNRDGNMDLAVANNADDSVTILLGDGAGGFNPAQGSPVALGKAPPQSIAVGDFNGDGIPDFVTAGSNGRVTVLFGDGTGGFHGAASFAVGQFPQSVATADVNGDGKLDIVTANSGANTVTVLLGNGLGGFTAAAGSPFAVGTTPQAVAIADVNGDGKPDIVAANASDNTISVLLGDGAGGFTAASASPLPAGNAPFALAAGDFNGDGRPDVAVADVSGGNVTVLLGGQAATSSVLSAPLGPGATIAYGTPIPLTLKAGWQSGGFGAPSGTATFLDGGVALGTAAQTGTPYSFTATGMSPGAHSFTATYGGDGANLASVSNAIAVTVTAAAQTIAFGALSNKTFGGVPIALNAAASSGLAVVFASTTPAVCTVSGAAVTLVGVGTCTIQASQPGDANFAAATAVSQHFTVAQGSQTITFAALPNAALGSTPPALGAIASSGLAVSFASTTSTICTVAGTALTLVAAGTCTIQATQAGNANYTAAPSVSQHFTVTPMGQTIAFGALSDQVFGSPAFAVSATASSGLAVTFTSTTTGVCTVSGTNVTLTGVGVCTIQAAQPGNSGFAAAPAVSQTFNVTKGSQTLTFAALSDKVFGSAHFTVSASASSGLTVAFASMTAPVCTVSGVSVTLVSAGTCTVEASQAGNATYGAATPVDQSFMVTAGAQTITFAALSSKAFGSAPFTVSATASSMLAVSFASTTTAVCTVSGASVTPAGAGTCTVEASQPGNVSYAAATPVDQSFAVTQGSQTITFAALSNQPFGSAPVTIAATASSSLAVAFVSATASVCTVSGATVTMMSAGKCTITATQPGDANYAAATAVNQSFTVAQETQTITFGTLPNEPLGGAPFTLTLASSSGLAVGLSSATPSVCTVSGVSGVSGNMVTLVGMGTCTLTAAQAGNTNFAAAPSVSQSFTVTEGTQTITFAAPPNQAIGNAPFGLSAASSSGLPVSFVSNSPLVCKVGGATVTVLSLGSCTIQATQAGNASYAAAAPVVQTFSVGAAVTVGSVLNAASYAAAPLAADGYTVVFGNNFAASTAQTPSVALPTTLAGARVTIIDSNKLAASAPLFYVSPTQINFLVPEGLALGSATVAVTGSDNSVASFATTIAQVSPALFTADSSGHGVPAALALSVAADGSAQSTPVFSCSGSPVVCSAVPISLGTASSSVYLVLFGTGIRGVSGLAGVSAMLGGKALQVVYAGAQGTFPGLDQVNVVLDRGLIGAGGLVLQLGVNGVLANGVGVSIQ
jgi:uncharacterized protein (TIGR03437 family)